MSKVAGAAALTVLFLVVVVPSSFLVADVLAQQQPASCEDAKARLEAYMQIIGSQRSNLEVQLASMAVELQKAKQDLAELKAKDKKEPEAKPKK